MVLVGWSRSLFDDSKGCFVVNVLLRCAGCWLRCCFGALCHFNSVSWLVVKVV